MRYRTNTRLTILATIAAAWSVNVIAQDDSVETQPDAQSVVISATDAMKNERWADAIEQYRQLRERYPDIAAIPYNLGVAQLNQGNLTEAAKQFREAISLSERQDIANRAAHNAISTAKLRLNQLMGQPQTEATEVQSTFEELRKDVMQALRQFQSAVDMSPDNRNARAQGERAQQTLDQIDQFEEMMQQQSSQDQQEDGEQDQSPDQQQPPEESEECEHPDATSEDQPESQRDQQQQNQDQDQQQQNQEQQQSQSPQEDQQQQDQQNQREMTGSKDESQSQDQTESEAQETQGDSGDSREGQSQQSAPEAEEPMTDQEAEQLLQSVRDKEKERREALAKLQAGTEPPVEKDW